MQTAPRRDLLRRIAEGVRPLARERRRSRGERPGSAVTEPAITLPAPGPHFDLAHGRDQSGVAPRLRAPLRRSIPPRPPAHRGEVHRRGAGVIGLAFEHYVQTALPDDRLHDAERQDSRLSSTGPCSM